MQIVSSGDNLHEMLNTVFLENKKNILECLQLKILPRLVSYYVITAEENKPSPLLGY